MVESATSAPILSRSRIWRRVLLVSAVSNATFLVDTITILRPEPASTSPPISTIVEVVEPSG